jgi:hypothetical protein
MKKSKLIKYIKMVKREQRLQAKEEAGAIQSGRDQGAFIKTPLAAIARRLPSYEENQYMKTHQKMVAYFQ